MFRKLTGIPGQDEDDAQALLAAHHEEPPSDDEGSITSEEDENEDEDEDEEEEERGASEPREVFNAAWEEANPWWGSGEKARGIVYMPPPALRDRLIADGLQVHWVQAGGDCAFEAMVVTAGQDQIRELIGAAVLGAGIVPQDEDDPVAWVVRGAMVAGAEHAAQTRDQVTQLLRQDAPERVDAALERMDHAYASLPPMAPGDAVTGQHLRLVVAFLLEHRFACPDGRRRPTGGGRLMTR